MRPLGIPLCSWGIRQKLTRQLEQGVLRLVSLELNASVFELGAELPGLRTQPRGAVLRARAEEAAPLVGPLEQVANFVERVVLRVIDYFQFAAYGGRGVLYPLLHTHTVARFVCIA